MQNNIKSLLALYQSENEFSFDDLDFCHFVAVLGRYVAEPGEALGDAGVAALEEAADNLFAIDSFRQALEPVKSYKMPVENNQLIYSE